MGFAHLAPPVDIAILPLALMFLAWCGGYVVRETVGFIKREDTRYTFAGLSLAVLLFLGCLFILDRVSELVWA